MGNVYYQLSDYEKATIHFEKALVISREVKDRSEEGKILFNLGISNYNLSIYEKAKDYLEQALHISRELEDLSEEGKTLYALGSVCDQLSDHVTAMAHYEQAMIIYRMLGDRMNEVKVYWDLSIASQLLNDSQVEIFYGKLAVNVYRETRGNLNESDNRSRKKFLADNSVRYRRVADILISEERSTEAQAVLNLLKELESDQSSAGSIKLTDLVPYSKGEAETIATIDNLVEWKRKKDELEKIKKTTGSLRATDQKKLDGIVAAIASASRAFRNSIERLKKSNF
ncbi:MAG: tetratricopeptide repeat protein [Acidobacteria bacterium]|nr:tetratricopeptide repeat protein [Acidobacteriota bacterium]